MIFTKKKQLEWALEVRFFFLSPKQRAEEKNDQVQKVLKMSPFPQI